MVRPSQRREMATRVVQAQGVSIRLACDAFRISESCYRYVPKLQAENTQIADWLIRLTENNRNWGFGLSFLYLRNVKGYGWNHKRVYRIYKELELNLRIRPKKRLLRENDLPRFFGPVITGERQPSVSWLNTLAVQTHSGSDSLGYCGVEPRCNAVATAR